MSHAALEPDERLETLAELEGEPDSAYADFIARAHASAGPELTAAIDPLLLLALARLAAQIFLACTEAAAYRKLRRMRFFPHGLLATKVRSDVTELLEAKALGSVAADATPEDQAADRRELANLYVDYAINHPDEVRQLCRKA